MDLTFRSEGRTYEWHGGFGCVIESVERGVKQGEVRVIERELMQACSVYPGWFYSRVCWIPVKDGSAQGTLDWIRAFKRKCFGVNCDD